MLNMSRRQFLKVSATTLAGSSLALLGFSSADALAEVRQYKLARTVETRGTCPYCAVACGILMYSLGDGAKNAKPAVIHVEGDPDNPVNRGTLCPKGSSLLDLVHSKSRLMVPEYRAPGSDKWVQISWEDALDRIAKLMKADRDANLVEVYGGERVNRWTTVGMLAASGASTEVGYLTHKVIRSMGLLPLDNQARV